MKIKQLLLISVLCIFSAHSVHAMQETKVANEQKEDRIVKSNFYEIDQFSPNSIKFLVKILGPQKNKKGKNQSKIIKNGLPKDLVYKICEYLKVYLYCFPNRTQNMAIMEVTSNFDYMFKKMVNFYDIDRLDFVSGLKIKPNDHNYFDILCSLTNPDNGNTHAFGSYFYAMHNPVLDISPEIAILEQIRRNYTKLDAFGTLIFITFFIIITSNILS